MLLSAAPRLRVRYPSPAILLAPGILLVCGAVGCSNPPAPETVPQTVEEHALHLFRVAREPDPSLERLSELFEIPQALVDRADLFEALAGLRLADAPTVTAVETLAALDAVAVDLTSPIPGGGEADYSVRLEKGGDTGWKVVWFRGPGLQWPEAPLPPDRGLTTSTPPG